jgi:hypothetical protein
MATGATGPDRSRTAVSYGQISPAQNAQPADQADDEKALPLPGWLLKLYFIFPVILYVPDAIFNYYVYSDGATVPQTDNIFLEISQIALWGFLSIGVVGMAYLLSMLAPWHWMQGHKIQAFFCGIGVVIATGITIWNSLAYRSESFKPFATDQWVYQFWPQLQANQISLTMIFAAVAPPFWGLFWAIVQPTQTHKNLAHLQESHAERVMRLQQEAELKAMRAEANAKIRAAQLKGMAQTAATAREQAAVVASQWRSGSGKKGDGPQAGDSGEHAGLAAAPERSQPSNILQMPSLSPGRPRELGNGRSPVMMNSVAPASPMTHAAPANGRLVPAQPALLHEADVQGSAGVPQSDSTWGAHRPQAASPARSADVAEAGEMTGTTGPRPAVRRAADPSPLLRAMNELPAAYIRAVDEARTELNPSGTRKSIPAKELAARVAKKLNVDEATASKIISRVREAQRASAR